MKKFLSFIVLASGLVFLAGCSTPETRIRQNPELFATLTAEQQQFIKEGKVAIGFDQGMVKLAIGEPDRVRMRTDSAGTSEIWSYVTYEGDDGVMLYRGWYHRYWGSPYYPYYRNYSSRREREHFRVVFKDDKVISIEQEN